MCRLRRQQCCVRVTRACASICSQAVVGIGAAETQVDAQDDAPVPQAAGSPGDEELPAREGDEAQPASKRKRAAAKTTCGRLRTAEASRAAKAQKRPAAAQARGKEKALAAQAKAMAKAAAKKEPAPKNALAKAMAKAAANNAAAGKSAPPAAKDAPAAKNTPPAAKDAPAAAKDAPAPKGGVTAPEGDDDEDTDVEMPPLEDADDGDEDNAGGAASVLEAAQTQGGDYRKDKTMKVKCECCEEDVSATKCRLMSKNKQRSQFFFRGLSDPCTRGGSVHLNT